MSNQHAHLIHVVHCNELQCLNTIVPHGLQLRSIALQHRIFGQRLKLCTFCWGSRLRCLLFEVCWHSLWDRIA